MGVGVLGPLPKTMQGNQFVVLMTDRYTKLTKATLTTKANATTVTSIFFENRVANYGTPSELLTDNGLRLVSKIFVAL